MESFKDKLLHKTAAVKSTLSSKIEEHEATLDAANRVNAADLESLIEEMNQKIDQFSAMNAKIESFFTDVSSRFEEVWGRISKTEEDKGKIFTDIFSRFEEVWDRISKMEEDKGRIFTDVFGRFEEVWGRINKIEKFVNVDSGLTHLRKRIDTRIIRLEVLMYYLHPEHSCHLTKEQKELIEQLWTHYGYEINAGHAFPPDPFYRTKTPSGLLSFEGMINNIEIPEVLEEDGQCYVMLSGHKLYLPHDKAWGEKYMQNIYESCENLDSPHCYLNPDDDGIDLSEGTILADIGAAEGFFGIKYLDRCKKIYFFETDPTWLKVLEKTCAPYKDKIEIVKGFVGDQPGNIHLDEFFAQRGEKPTFIKMDIEGAEGSALRSMPQLLADNSPLTMLICTYHRQEDWGHFYEILKDKFSITSSRSYYWHVANMRPPFLRHGVMRARKKV